MRVLLACGLGLLLLAGAGTAGDAKGDLAKLKGKWTAEIEGKGKIEIEFAKDTFTITFDGKEAFKGTYKIDASKKPKEMDLTVKEGPLADFKDKTALAIYAFDGETLKWCATEPGKEGRPKEFPEKQGEVGEHLYLVYKKVK